MTMSRALRGSLLAAKASPAAARASRAEREAAARAPSRPFVLRKTTQVIVNRDVSFSTQLPFYVRVSVADIRSAP